MSDRPTEQMPALRHLCRATVQLGDRFVIDGAVEGKRVISEMASAQFKGPRLEAGLCGRAAADWLHVSDAQGIGNMDVRYCVRTNDGALIHVQYRGRMRYARDAGPHVLYVTPLFETSDIRYAWLNAVQAVGKGLLDPVTRQIDYDFYELA